MSVFSTLQFRQFLKSLIYYRQIHLLELTELSLQWFCRSNHNELEKNRRAHLRHCFDELRRVVPLAHDSPRHTTLGLLRRARHVIKEMEECHKRKQCCLRELIQEHNCLLDKQRLVGDVGLYRRDTHTISESSSGSPVSSGSSCFSEHEGSTSDDEEHTGVDAEFDCNLNISLGL